MKKVAYLTIDDGPTERTPAITDLLAGRGARAVMFFTGEQLERHPEEAAYAIKAGMIAGNHSTSHPRFSRLRFDQAVNEISLQEDRLEELHAKAGVARAAKVFRFPYGDKGGENEEAIQDFLGESGFKRLRAPRLRGLDHLGKHPGADFDLTWTFDSCDYLFTQEGGGWTKEKYVERIDGMRFRAGNGFWAPRSEELILMHDHPRVDQVLPGYFAFYLAELSRRGVCFKAPTFR